MENITILFSVPRQMWIGLVHQLQCTHKRTDTVSVLILLGQYLHDLLLCCITVTFQQDSVTNSDGIQGIVCHQWLVTGLGMYELMSVC